MKTFIKLILLLSILFLGTFTFCTNYSFADNTITNDAAQITTTVSTTNSPDDEIFSVTNIINILLIAVGIVLILLAIAIFIRLKR